MRRTIVPLAHRHTVRSLAARFPPADPRARRWLDLLGPWDRLQVKILRLRIRLTGV